MISINREGSKIVLLVSHGLSTTEGPLKFEWECGRDIHAAALAVALQKHFSETVQSIRRDEYETGHRDGRRHLSRRDSFARNLAPVMDWMKKRRT